MKILVTGSKGFVGKNLSLELKNLGHEVLTFDREDSLDVLDKHTATADCVVHLAGVNRPTNTEDFYTGNAGLTETLIGLLQKHKNKATVIGSSSIQASLANDYGKSKLEGEILLKQHAQANGSKVYIYRFSNLFGKWSKPNYNTVIATWCHNISRDIPITINDPSVRLNLTYIDDVMKELTNAIQGEPTLTQEGYGVVHPIYDVSLEEIHNLLIKFKESRINHFVPNMEPGFETSLYSTYLSFLPTDKFSYPLKMNVDERGSFTEFIKSKDRGQVSINISKPGITKGEHWHHSKNEKFLVVQGQGVIKLRNVFNNEVIEYHVSGDQMQVVDIPTGYTHNIINNGSSDMVTVMWVNEPFDPNHPDTYFLPVEQDQKS